MENLGLERLKPNLPEEKVLEELQKALVVKADLPVKEEVLVKEGGWAKAMLQETKAGKL